MTPASMTRIRTTVVAGLDGPLRTRLIEQLRSARPDGERWAWIRSDVTPTDDREVFSLGGGCACCLAGPPFRVMLARILQSGPWQRLIIDVDSAGHPEQLVDQLRTMPFDRALQISELLLVIGAGEAVTYRGGPTREVGPGSANRLSWATDILLATGSSAVGFDPTFAAFLETVGPWPRLERIAGRRLRASSSGFAADLPGWRIFSLLADEADPDDADLSRRWPADTVLERRPVRDMLTRLISDSGIVGFQAVLRTPRAWYCWRHGRGAGAQPFTVGRELDEQETGWRFDNRIHLWLAAGARRRSVDARLVEIDLAIQGPDGIVDPATS